jgi:hypothetical protein
MKESYQKEEHCRRIRAGGDQQWSSLPRPQNPAPAGPKDRSWCNRLWLLKKSLSLKNCLNLGIENVQESRESFIGLERDSSRMVTTACS